MLFCFCVSSFSFQNVTVDESGGVALDGARERVRQATAAFLAPENTKAERVKLAKALIRELDAYAQAGMFLLVPPRVLAAAARLAASVRHLVHAGTGQCTCASRLYRMAHGLCVHGVATQALRLGVTPGSFDEQSRQDLLAAVSMLTTSGLRPVCHS